MTGPSIPGYPEPARVLVLCGPTAAGKTDLALALADRMPVDIISADAAQVYRGMDIGTAKPDAGVLARVPHRLVDIREPHETYSAAEFSRDARSAIEDSLSRQRLPVVVGGTMFYVSALVEGLSELPRADAGLRAEILDWARRQGWASLHRALADVDPELAGHVRPTDRQRLQRAHEIHRVTGRPPSAVMRECRPRGLEHGVLKIALFHPRRHELHGRIHERFGQMVDRGLIDEVARLRRDPRLTADSVSMRTVGYRQAWRYLDGVIDRDAFVASAVAATRQLAKRQLTWLRGMSGMVWMDATHAATLDNLLIYMNNRIRFPEGASAD